MEVVNLVCALYSDSMVLTSFIYFYKLLRSSNLSY